MIIMSNKLYNLTRLDNTDRPNINEQCFFSPCIEIVPGIFIIDTRKMLQSYMRENNLCTVIKHGDYTEQVRFNKQQDIDIVSPEFLLRKQLTSFGLTVMQAYKQKVSPKCIT